MERTIEPVVYVVTTSSSSILDWATFGSSIAALISAVIAAAALWFTRKQLIQAQSQNRLLVKPYLASWIHTDETENVYMFAIENTGIGPAIIKKVTVTVGGKEIPGKLTKQIENAGDEIIPSTHERSIEMFGVGDYVPAGRRFEVYRASSKILSPTEIEQNFADRARIIVEYESIAGEQYKLDSNYS